VSDLINLSIATNARVCMEQRQIRMLMRAAQGIWSGAKGDSFAGILQLHSNATAEPTDLLPTSSQKVRPAK